MPQESWALAGGSIASVFRMLGTICLIGWLLHSAHCSACSGRSALTHVPGNCFAWAGIRAQWLLAAWHRGFSRSGLISAGFQRLAQIHGLGQGQDRAMRLCGNGAQPGGLRHSCYCAVQACRRECCEHTATALATGCTLFGSQRHMSSASPALHCSTSLFCWPKGCAGFAGVRWQAGWQAAQLNQGLT